MPSNFHLAELLSECADLDGTKADRVIQVLIRVGVISQKSVEMFERDARIYKLRRGGLRPCDLMVRFGMSRTRLFEAIKRHEKRSREALRMSW